MEKIVIVDVIVVNIGCFLKTQGNSEINHALCIIVIRQQSRAYMSNYILLKTKACGNFVSKYRVMERPHTRMILPNTYKHFA